MKAIVHIGTEKTGSTSIQEYLFQNRVKLAEYGYYFLQSAGPKNNRALPAYCLLDDKPDDFFRDQGIISLSQRKKFQRKFLKRFRKEIDSIPEGIHTVVISSEHFHSRVNTPEEIENLRKLLSPIFADITIVCYLRDQASMCVSYYSTAIKSGHRLSFANFLQNCNTTNLYYNYSEMLSNWETTFGADSLRVSVFSPDQFLNGDLLDDFTARINSELVGQLDKDVLVENESLSFAGQVLGRAVNDVFPSSAREPETIALRNRCQKIIYDNCRGRGEQPSLDEQRRIYDEFADSNEQVRLRFFPGRSVLFPLALKEVSTDKSLDAGFIEALSGVFDTIVEGQQANALPPKEPDTLPDNFADIFRKAALKIEKQDLKLACDLMSLAHEIRPAGPFIKRKLGEYRQKLEG